MAENTSISWTDHTFNPWIGCQRVAPGCQHCYAEAFAKRYGKAEWGPQGTRVKTSESYWKQPIKWDREAAKTGIRKRVFCASMADVFEDWPGAIHSHRGQQLFRFGNHGEMVDQAFRGPEHRRVTMDDVRRYLFTLIDATPNLDWLLLSKRPENIQHMWPLATMIDVNNDPFPELFRPNVWLGCSVSEQETADQNIPELLKCRDLAPVLFVSYEPVLGPVVFDTLARGGPPHYLTREVDHLEDASIDQLIIGCESSGPRVGSMGEFPTEAAWLANAESVVAQCLAAGVRVHVKQIPSDGMVLHDMAQFPEALRFQEFPEVRQARSG